MVTWKWCVITNETCSELKMSLSFWGFLGLLLVVCDLSHNLRQLIRLWSYADRNFSRISICSMGMWQLGISWSKVILLLSSVDWAWLMKSMLEGPSRLLTPYLSSGSPQNGFCWDQLASAEMCTVCSRSLDFFPSWPRCPPVPDYDCIGCQLCLHAKSLLRSQTDSPGEIGVLWQSSYLASGCNPF